MTWFSVRGNYSHKGHLLAKTWLLQQWDNYKPNVHHILRHKLVYGRHCYVHRTHYLEQISGVLRPGSTGFQDKLQHYYLHYIFAQECATDSQFALKWSSTFPFWIHMASYLTTPTSHAQLYTVWQCIYCWYLFLKRDLSESALEHQTLHAGLSTIEPTRFYFGKWKFEIYLRFLRIGKISILGVLGRCFSASWNTTIACC